MDGENGAAEGILTSDPIPRNNDVVRNDTNALPPARRPQTLAGDAQDDPRALCSNASAGEDAGKHARRRLPGANEKS